MESIVPSLATLKQITDAFVNELELANDGKQTSLAFVKNPLSLTPLVMEGERFQVMACGGTMFHMAIVHREHGVFVLENYEARELPRFMTKDDFLSFIASHLDKETNVLALNFAFPMTPIVRDGRLDGILFRAVKEHEFKGLVNEAVGFHIEQYIKKTLGRSLKVAVANDVVCLVLSGSGIGAREQLVGAIVGSGYNIGFFLEETTLVNLEAGNFDKFPLSPIGKEIDENSATPGKNVFEKEMAGVGLYLHFNRIVEKEGIDHPLLSSTKELDQIAASDGVASEIARDLFRRSAALFATQIAGVYFFKGHASITFVMEGSVFWKGWHYQEMVAEYLSFLGVPEGAIAFVKVENSTILGAAALVA